MVSIIVPVYNVFDLLDRCIESICNQVYKDIEIILVNDGSTDDSLTKCESWACRDSRIKVINKENGGLSSARNEGLKAAAGEWILFVDSDDYIDSNLCSHALECANNYQADMVIFGLYKAYPSENVKLEADGIETGILPKAEVMKLLGNDSFGNYAWNKLYKSSQWSGLNYPDGKNFEDVATTCFAVEKADKICYLKEALYYYVQRDNSIMHSKSRKSVMDQFDNRLIQIEFFRTYYPEAVDYSMEAFVRSAVTYCVYFYNNTKDERYITAKAELLKIVKLPAGSKVRVKLFYNLLKHAPILFRAISGFYMSYLGI